MEYEISEHETVTEAIVFAIGESKGLDPTSLEPLTNVVEPDALERLFDKDDDRRGRGSLFVSFVYSDYLVTVGKQVVETTPVLQTRT